MQFINRVLKYVKKNGIKNSVIRADRYIAGKKMLRNCSVPESELSRQRNENFAYSPLISVITPLYNTPVPFLTALLDCMIGQTYGEWEICLADGSGRESSITEICLEYCKKDPRIKYRLLNENGGISANTNAALDMAHGEFIMLADHDDLIEPDALYEIVKAINEDEEADSFYTDEDKIDMKGKKRSEPHCKPDFNIEYLRTNNYICHIFATRRSIALSVGGFDTRTDGAQDYDFILKCIEKSRKVCHIPKILYHWRCHSGSTASAPENKMYAYMAGINAIKAHYERLGIAADVSLIPGLYGYYRADRKWSADATKDVTLIMQKGGGAEDTAAINAGIEAAGEYILLLGRDIVYGDDLVYNLLQYICDPEVGTVTVRICGGKNRKSPKKLIQGPIILGLGGLYDYSFKGASASEKGYYYRAVMPQNVTVADHRCVMIKKSLVLKFGGLCEELPPGLAVADYCLQTERDGKRCVYNPHAEVVYTGKDPYPSYSDSDIEMFKSKWKDRIDRGDQYYNRNFLIFPKIFG